MTRKGGVKSTKREVRMKKEGEGKMLSPLHSLILAFYGNGDRK